MPRGIRLTFKNEQLGASVKRSMKRNGEAVRQATRYTAELIAQEIKREGDKDIRSAGKFSSRWTDAFQAVTSEGGGNIRIRVTMGIPYYTVHEFGAVIKGQPLLWIPLSFATDAKGVLARNYPAPLFRVDRNNGKAPLLLTPGNPAQVKYFGISEVTIPKRFHLHEIAQRHAKSIAAVYREQLKRVLKNG